MENGNDKISGQRANHANEELEKQLFLFKKTTLKINQMSTDLTKFFMISPNVLCVIGEDGLIKHINPAFRYILGWEEQELTGFPFRDFIHPEDIDIYHHEIDNLRTNVPVLIARFRFRCKDSTFRLIRWTAYPDEERLYVIGQEVVVSQPPNNDLFRIALEAAPTAIILTDMNGNITYANSHACQVFGFKRKELSEKHIDDLVPIDYRENHKALRDKYLEKPSPRPMGRNRDLLACRKDGSIFPVEIGLNPIERGPDTYIICSISDLTDRKQAEEKMLEMAEKLEEENINLEILASTDGLTGLLNRRALVNWLNQLLKTSLRNKLALSLIMLDIDHFKLFNDTFGHPSGDEVLKSFAMLLDTHSRHNDKIGRYGGEEFMLVLPDTNEEGACALAEKIRLTVEEYNWPLRQVTASLGVASVNPEDIHKDQLNEIAIKLTEDADRALYNSKRAGRNRVTHAASLE
ncbi:MAG: diguanylate cyclase [Anaerolineales bacterium]|nr:diguanylate cyclase [Anaerolineales bacterium]